MSTSHEDVFERIERFRKERNAVILAHYYQQAEIQDLADFIGDSLELSKKARDTDADVIVFCGVHFMAETAKIVNPDKTVLIPHQQAGCSLAESITAADVRLLKERYPGVPVVTYVNTYADVKAVSDICIGGSRESGISAGSGSPGKAKPV